jgi:hypothetical protein
MNSTLIRQTIGVSWLVAIVWIALLVGILLLHISMVGAHPAHTGIMLIDPPYQIV